jgi:hypothetical protein
MPTKTIACPDCGLVLQVSPIDAGSTLVYDVSEWQRRCKRLDLDGPAWCLVRRDGTHPKKREIASLAAQRRKAPTSPQDVWHEQMRFMKEMVSDCEASGQRFFVALAPSRSNGEAISPKSSTAQLS